MPKSYYITNTKPVPKKNMESSNISAGGKKLIAFEITRIHSILRFPECVHLSILRNLINDCICVYISVDNYVYDIVNVCDMLLLLLIMLLLIYCG